MDTIMLHPRLRLRPCHIPAACDPHKLVGALVSTPNASMDQEAIAISADACGLGLSAKADLPANHPLLVIPTAVLIGSNPSSPLPALIRDPLLKHPSRAMANPTIHLAVTLLHLALSALSTEPASKLWDAYIDTLPAAVDSPAYLTPHTIQRLPAHFPAFDHGRDINAALYNLFSLADANDSSSFGHLLHTTLAPTRIDRRTFFSHFVWAYAMVESRAFRPFASANPDLPVLVPFADLMNHSSIPIDVNVKYMAAKSGGLQFVTTRPVKANEPLVLKYNDLSSADELVYYGFAQQGNPIPDSVDLSLPPLAEESDSALLAIKRALLIDARPIENLAMHHSISEMDSAANVLLSARVHTATLDELTGVLQVKDPTRTGDLNAHKLLHGISGANDAKAYALLARIVTDLKHMLTHSVDLDQLPTDACRVYVRRVWEQVNNFIQYFDLSIACIPLGA